MFERVLQQIREENRKTAIIMFQGMKEYLEKRDWLDNSLVDEDEMDILCPLQTPNAKMILRLSIDLYKSAVLIEARSNMEVIDEDAADSEINLINGRLLFGHFYTKDEHLMFGINYSYLGTSSWNGQAFDVYFNVAVHTMNENVQILTEKNCLSESAYKATPGLWC